MELASDPRMERIYGGKYIFVTTMWGVRYHITKYNPKMNGHTLCGRKAFYDNVPTIVPDDLKYGSVECALCVNSWKNKRSKYVL